MLVWRRGIHLIDHGSALYFHHDWARMTTEKAKAPFSRIGDHIFITEAGTLEQIDEAVVSSIGEEDLSRVLEVVPDELLADPVSGEPTVDPAELRRRYVAVLNDRLSAPRAWVAAAAEEGRRATAAAPTRLESRR